MASVRISSLECSKLIFIDTVVTINGSYYRNTLLRQHLLPAIRLISGPFFTFQQDNAPAHHARKTVAPLSADTPSDLGLGPVRYMTISVHTTSVQVFRQIRNLDHFGTCKRSTTSVYTTSVH